MRFSAIVSLGIVCVLTACAANPAPKNPIWSFSKTTLNDSKTKVTLYDQSSNRAERYGRRADDTLVIEAACVGGRTGFRLLTDDYYRTWRGSHAPLDVQIDDQPVFRRRMRLDYDKGALLIGSSRDAISFLRSLYGHSTLVMTAWPGRADGMTLKFNISSVEDHLKPVRDACKW